MEGRDGTGLLKEVGKYNSVREGGRWFNGWLKIELLIVRDVSDSGSLSREWVLVLKHIINLVRGGRESTGWQKVWDINVNSVREGRKRWSIGRLKPFKDKWMREEGRESRGWLQLLSSNFVIEEGNESSAKI